MLQSPSELDFDNETRRLLADIHMFDVLRSDRSVSSNGLEGRTPFLDKAFVTTYLQIPAYIRNPRSDYNKKYSGWDDMANQTLSDTNDHDVYNTICSRPEKLLLRSAFHSLMPDLLPRSVLWRGKEAFSDGVSGSGKSWYEIINSSLNELAIPFKNTENMDKHMNPDTKEKLYYRSLFCNNFKLCDYTIPYFWMPKFVEATDSSARTLKHYTSR